ncbi:hypothetical protein D3C76_994660 [compost metagenome]
MVAVHVAFGLTEATRDGSAVFKGVTGCQTVDVVDLVRIGEGIAGIGAALGEAGGVLEPGRLVLIGDGVGQVEAAEVAFDLATAVGTGLIGPVDAEDAGYIELGVTTLGGDSVTELEFQGGGGEAEAILGNTVTT